MPVVRLPSVLDPATGGVRRVEVEGGTIAEALEDLCRRLPAIRVHLFEERGAIRPHVVRIHDGVDRRRALATPVDPGDEIAILQAISGGAAAGG